MRKARLIGTAMLAVLGAAPGAGHAAERPWLEVRSPHFTVLSNAGEGQARDIAWQFERVRALFEKLWPWARQADERPFVVVIARDEETLRALAPGYFTGGKEHASAGVYVSGPTTDFVALRTDLPSGADSRVNPYLSAFQGYADNMLVRHFAGRMPEWYRDGLGQILGNTLVRDKDVEVGRVIYWHLDALKGRGTDTIGVLLDDRERERRRTLAPGTRSLVPLQRLLVVGHDDPERTGEVARRQFAAQSWALVHYLMFGEGGAHRAKFNQMTDLLRSGVDGAQATAQALGDVSALDAGYRRYIDDHTFQFQRIPLDIDVAKERWAARPLAAPEADEVLASFREAVERPRTVVTVRRPPPPVPASSPAPALGVAASPGDLIQACNAGDHAACGRLVPSLQAACEADGAMCMALAFLYKNGRGVLRDETKAEALYARACAAAQPRACAHQARMILGRSGADGDVAEARRLLDRACKAGQADACGGVDRQ